MSSTQTATMRGMQGSMQPLASQGHCFAGWWSGGLRGSVPPAGSDGGLMRKLTFAVLLTAGSAHAHFRFLLPDGGSMDWLQVGAYGDPTGGDQKTGPCGIGTVQSNVVTTLTAGQQYGVRIEETITHGGHYRVAIAQNRATFPVPTAAADC